MSRNEVTLNHYLSKYAALTAADRPLGAPANTPLPNQLMAVHDHFLFALTPLNEIEVIDLSPLSLSEHRPAKILNYEPELTSPVCHLSVSDDGGHLVLGTPEVILVLELTRLALVNSNEEHSSFCSSMAKVITCPSHVLAVNLYDSIPGFAVLKMAWHPLSPGHLLVLSNDNMLRLYNLKTNSREAEQVLSLSTHFGDAEVSVISFSFVRADCATWEAHAVYLMTDAGDIYMLCPLVPNGAFIQRSAFLSLRRATDRELELLSPYSEEMNARAMLLRRRRSWIDQMLGDTADTPDDAPFDNQWVRAHLPVDQDFVPDLQGPTLIENRGDRDDAPRSFRDLCLIHASPPVALRMLNSADMHLLVFTSPSEPLWHADRDLRVRRDLVLPPPTAVIWQRFSLSPAAPPLSHFTLTQLGRRATQLATTFYLHNRVGIFQLALPSIAQLDAFLRNTSNSIGAHQPTTLTLLVDFRTVVSGHVDAVLAVSGYLCDASNVSSGLLVYLLRLVDRSRHCLYHCSFYYLDQPKLLLNLPSSSHPPAPPSLSPPAPLPLPQRPGPIPLLPPNAFVGSGDQQLHVTANLKSFVNYYSNVKRVHVLYLYDISEQLKDQCRALERRTRSQCAQLTGLSSDLKSHLDRRARFSAQLRDALSSQEALNARALRLLAQLRSLKNRITTSERRWFNELTSLKQTLRHHQQSLDDSSNTVEHTLTLKDELVNSLCALELSPHQVSKLEAMMDREHKVIEKLVTNLEILKLKHGID